MCLKEYVIYNGDTEMRDTERTGNRYNCEL